MSYQPNPRDERASSGRSEVKAKAAELGRAATDATEQARMKTAEGLDATAQTMHEGADSLPGGPRVASVAHSAADALQTGADYIRQNDFAGMTNDVLELVKRNPGPAVLCAAALGFVVGRAFVRD